MPIINLFNIGIYAAVIIVALMVIGMIFSRLYKRSSKELAYVRTGFGGQKVIMNGGALVFPVLHETTWVNMNTLRLEVRRANEQALITRDRMRADVGAEFYVRVKPDEHAIATAAQTLGQKTTAPAELKQLIEGKFVDALRAVAAGMEMSELHENRTDFVQKVQQAVAEDLSKNGLELESVSLTSLDQTAKEYFNPNNAFDAQGLTKLTEEIEQRKKERNDIEQNTMVAIKTKNLEAEQKSLEIFKEEEYARLAQEREIEMRKAQQAKDIAMERATQEQASQEADINAKRQVDLTRIESEKDTEEQRIAKERLVREKEIERERAIETAEVERKKVVQLAEQDRQIAVAEKSEAESQAEAVAAKARAHAVTEEEKVITARETEQATRAKQVEIIDAMKHAETQAISIKVAAEAEKFAAEDNAEAIRIDAQGAADAVLRKAEADEKAYAVQAEGERALNLAANTLSDGQIKMKISLGMIEQLPEIIREQVKPMEKIDSIKILQMDGMNQLGGNGAGSDGNSASGGNMPQNLVNSMLQYQMASPFVKHIMDELELGSLDEVENLASSLTRTDKPAVVKGNPDK